MNQKTGSRCKCRAAALDCRYPRLQSCIGTILHEGRLEGWEKDFLKVFVPPLAGFVRWAVKEAARDGCSRIYFPARDGYLMKAVAEYARDIWQLPDVDGKQPKMHYLEVSRLSLRRAQYHLVGDRCLDHICAGGTSVTMETILNRSGVSAGMADFTIDHLGYRGRTEVPLNWKELCGLAEALKNVPGFLEEVYQFSRANYPGTIRYLEKEGLLDGQPCAVIDTGWIGTVRESLECLVKNELQERGRTGYPLIRGYYFGLYELPKGVDASLYKAYYFQPWKDVRRKTYFSNSLLEAVWSAPDPQTVGYTADGMPLYGCRGNPNADRIQREKELLDMLFQEYRADEPIMPEECERLLGRFMGRPTKRQAEDYGSLLFCDDMLDGKMQEVALPLDGMQLQKQGLFWHVLEALGLYKGKIPESAWLEGSIVRNGGQVRQDLLRGRIYKALIYMKKYCSSLRNIYTHEGTAWKK